MKEIKNNKIEPKNSDFLEYFKVLRRRKWMVILCLIVIVLPVVLFNQLFAPVFEAEAVIIYEEPHDTMFALDMGQPFYNKSAILNLSEQIKSRTIAEEVAKTLPVQVIQTFKFPEPIPPDFSQNKFIARQLQRRISVIGVRGADILKIKLEANNPTVAKIIANIYVDRILEWNLQKKREVTSNIRKFVEDQLIIFQDKLNTAEDSLRIFKESNKMVSLSESATEILSRMTEVEISYNQVRTERLALEQRKRYIDRKNQENASSFSLVSSSLAQQLKQKLAF